MDESTAVTCGVTFVAATTFVAIRRVASLWSGQNWEFYFQLFWTKVRADDEGQINCDLCRGVRCVRTDLDTKQWWR